MHLFLFLFLLRLLPFLRYGSWSDPVSSDWGKWGLQPSRASWCLQPGGSLQATGSILVPEDPGWNGTRGTACLAQPCPCLSGPQRAVSSHLQAASPPQVPSKFFLPSAHLNQNSLSLSPQLIRSDYLIKGIRTEVWMRLNPPRGICILNEELVNPNASTIRGMCGEAFGGLGAFPCSLPPRWSQT